MRHKRVLLMFISEVSGHHQASLAIEEALHILDPNIITRNINAFHFTNPVLEKIINRTYMSVIKNVPEIWDYLYDNPRVVERTRKLKNIIHRHNSAKLLDLIDEFKPDSVVCTQAFPCGMVADLKKHHNLSLAIIGVLTDYAPHSYWIYNNMDAYVVPSEETGEKLVASGIAEEKIKPFGVPIYPKFNREPDRLKILKELGLAEKLAVILIMGGGQGLGPIKNIVTALDRVPGDLQMIVVAGSNKHLYNYLKERIKRFKKGIFVAGFADNVDEFMSVATMIITKPGGLTTAEALAKRVPMVIINPLPGQEAMNAKYLVGKGLAVKVKDEKELSIVVEELLENTSKLDYMRELAKNYAKPNAAVETARLVLKLN